MVKEDLWGGGSQSTDWVRITTPPYESLEEKHLGNKELVQSPIGKNEAIELELVNKGENDTG